MWNHLAVSSTLSTLMCTQPWASSTRTSLSSLTQICGVGLSLSLSLSNVMRMLQTGWKIWSICTSIQYSLPNFHYVAYKIKIDIELAQQKVCNSNKNPQAELRMLDQRARQVERGTDADALQPEWCRQNEALCYLRV